MKSPMRRLALLLCGALMATAAAMGGCASSKSAITQPSSGETVNSPVGGTVVWARDVSTQEDKLLTLTTTVLPAGIYVLTYDSTQAPKCVNSVVVDNAVLIGASQADMGLVQFRVSRAGKSTILLQGVKGSDCLVHLLVIRPVQNPAGGSVLTISFPASPSYKNVVVNTLRMSTATGVRLSGVFEGCSTSNTNFKVWNAKAASGTPPILSMTDRVGNKFNVQLESPVLVSGETLALRFENCGQTDADIFGRAA